MNESTTAVGVGVIGGGAIAAEHVRGYQASGANLVALCETNTDTLTRRAKEWNIHAAYATADELLADPRVQAVSICTPNATHHPITLAAAAAGKHVLCEKPVSMDLRAGQEMIDACAAAGVVFQVGHHMRSWSTAARAHALIEAGELGDIAYIRLRQAHDWGGREVRGVFGSKAHSGGGTLLDNGCHMFDLARYLGGDVADVFARIATRQYEVEVEDTATASLSFTSGAIGQVEVGWTATGFQEGFWIYGTKGSLECDTRVARNVLTHRLRQSTGTTWHDTDVFRYELHGRSSHGQHVANFLAAIDGSGPVVCTGSDGLEAVRLVLASYDSAERGIPVRLGSD